MRVAVIGGGVVGLWSALHLLERGCSVTVVEPEDLRRYSASHNSAGILRVSHEDGFLAGSAFAGLKMWTALAREVGVTIERADVVMLYGNTDLARAERVVRNCEETGTRISLLTPNELKKTMPQIHCSDDMWGTLESTGGVVSASVILGKARAYLTKRGVMFVNDTVTSWNSESEVHVFLKADRLTLSADRLVIAAGVGSLQHLSTCLAGVIVTKIVSIDIFACTQRRVSQSTVILDQTNSHYYVCKQDGTLIVGSPAVTTEEWQFYESHIERKRKAEAERRFRYFRNYEYLHTRKAADGYTRNKCPIVEFLDANENVLLASGCSGAGFKLAPAIGLTVANLLCGQNGQRKDRMKGTGVSNCLSLQG